MDLLICCGDFQGVRNARDLKCMSVPDKYKTLGTFHRYFRGERRAPVPTLFIGGNHEASNYLWELYYGGFVAPDIYYLGHSGVVRFGNLRVGGLSGILKGTTTAGGHYERPPYTRGGEKSADDVRQFDVDKLRSVREPIDVFLSHDWPRGISRYGDWADLTAGRGSRLMSCAITPGLPPRGAPARVEAQVLVQRAPPRQVRRDGAPRRMQANTAPTSASAETSCRHDVPDRDPTGGSSSQGVAEHLMRARTALGDASLPCSPRPTRPRLTTWRGTGRGSTRTSATHSRRRPGLKPRPGTKTMPGRIGRAQPQTLRRRRRALDFKLDLDPGGAAAGGGLPRRMEDFPAAPPAPAGVGRRLDGGRGRGVEVSDPEEDHQAGPAAGEEEGNVAAAKRGRR